MGAIYVTDPATGLPQAIQISGAQPTETEAQRIRDWQASRAPAVPAPMAATEDDNPPGFALGRGIGLGLAGLQSRGGEAISAVGELTGLEGLQSLGQGLAQRGQARAQEIGGMSLGDVEGVGSGLSYVGEIAGASAPEMGVNIAGTIAGGKAGAALGSLAGPAGTAVGALLGGLAGGALAVYPFMFGGNVEEQRQQAEARGERIEPDYGAAALGAVGQSALNAISGKIALRGFAPKPGQSILTRITKGTIEGVAVEAPTEIGQEMIQIAQAGGDITSDEAIDRYIEAGIAGGILGGAVGGTATGVRAAAERRAERKKADIEADIEAEIARAEQFQRAAVANDIRSSAELPPGIAGLIPDLRQQQADKLQADAETYGSEMAAFMRRRAEGAQRALPPPTAPTQPEIGPPAPMTSPQGPVIVPPTGQDLARLRQAEVDADQGRNIGARRDAVLGVLGPSSEREATLAPRALPSPSMIQARMDAEAGRIESEKYTQRLIDREAEKLVEDVQIKPSADPVQQQQNEKVAQNTKAKRVSRAKGTIKANQAVQKAAKAPAIQEAVKDAVAEATPPKRRISPESAQAARRAVQNAAAELGVKLEPKKAEAPAEAPVVKMRQRKAADIKGKLKKMLDPTGGYIELEAGGRKYGAQWDSNSGTYTVVDLQDGSYDPDSLIGSKQELQQYIQRVAQSGVTIKQRLKNREAEMRKGERMRRDAMKADLGERREIEVIDEKGNATKRIATRGELLQEGYTDEMINLFPPVRKSRLLGAAREDAKATRPIPPGLVTRLREYLDKLNLKDVDLELVSLIDKDAGIEGTEEVRAAKSVISLAMNIYDPNMSDASLMKALGEVLNHEIIHALRTLNLFTPAEFETLIRAAASQKRVVNGKKRAYTYLEFQQAKNARAPKDEQLSPEAVVEEAIAEMFRDHSAGRLKLAGKPQGLWQKLGRFFKAVATAGRSLGYENAGDIFRRIESGEIGARDRGPLLRGGDTEAQAVDINNASKMAQATRYSRLIEQSDEFKEWNDGNALKDENGDPVLLFRGLTFQGEQPEPQMMRLEPKRGYAVFASPNPYLANTYALTERYEQKAGMKGMMIPFYVWAKRVKEFPSNPDGTFDMKGFDEFAKRLLPGEVGVVRKVRDIGYTKPSKEIDPEGRYEELSDIYAFNKAETKKLFEFSAPPDKLRYSRLSKGRRKPSDVGAVTGVPMPTSLAKAYRLARDNKFQTGRDLKLALQRIALEEQERSGIDLSKLDAKTEDRIADFVFEDAMEAVQDNLNAIGWYDRKVRGAKRELARLYPELADGGEHEFAFIWALAVTSNGLKVDKNFELAADAYEYWRENGRFPTKIGVGQAKKAINEGLAMYETLKNKFDGDWERAREFMVNESAVRDIEAASDISISGEGKGEIVRGAAILGPKIGNGFFSNLYGHFDALTMDRWLMRTVGRWRGTLIGRNPEMEAKKREEIRAVLKDLGSNSRPALIEYIKTGLSENKQAMMPEITDTMSDADIDLFAQLVQNAGATGPEWRAGLNEMPGGDEIRKLGNALAKYIDGQVEAPGGTKERAFLRRAFRKALARLQEQPGMEAITMSDLQALLWYPEKLLYDTAKKNAGEEVKSYEDDDAPDYENAARKLVEARLARMERDGGGRGGRERPADQPDAGTEEGAEAQPRKRRSARVKPTDVAPAGKSSDPNVRKSRVGAVRHTATVDLARKALGIVPFVDRQSTDAFAEKMFTLTQDSFLPVGKMVDHLREQGVDVENANDPYLREMISHGIIGAEADKNKREFYEKIIRPLNGMNVSEDKLNDLRSRSNYFRFREEIAEADLTLKERLLKRRPDVGMMIGDAYLYALHAKERNRFAAKDQEADPEFGSGMKDSEADAIINWVERQIEPEDKAKLEEARKYVRAMIADTTARRIESGLISQKVAEIYEDEDGNTMYDDRNFNDYIPLRGIRGDDMAPIAGSRMGVKRGGGGREDPAMRGRGAGNYAAFSPILTAITQNSEAIIRSERNKVVQTMAKLVRENPRLIRGSVTDKGPKRLGDLRYTAFKENGEVKYIFHEDERIGRAFDKTMNPATSNAVVQFMYRTNRLLSQLSTTWNPEFLFTNFPRDIETALINATQYEIEGVNKEILQTVWRAGKTVTLAVWKEGKYGNVGADVDPDWNVDTREATKEELLARWQEFMSAGGKQMLNPLTDIESTENQIKSMVADMKDGSEAELRERAYKLIQNLGRRVEEANEVGENASRFAFYMAMRRKGLSKEAAASAARNLTTNFSKKGELSTFLSAWSMFYNASMQGSMAMVNAAARSKKAQGALAAVVIAGFVQDMAYGMFSEEDETGRKAWDNIPDYEKEHNFFIPNLLGEGYFTIPLAYGLNHFFNTGRVMAAVSRGAMSVEDAVASSWGTLLELINPFGDDHSAIALISPTITDPFVAIYTNENFTGNPVKKEAMPGDPGTSAAYRHWNSTSPIFSGLAKTLNDWTGGNEVRPGFIDFSPDSAEYLFNHYTGGLGRFIERVFSGPWTVLKPALEGSFDGEMVEATPLVRRLYSAPSTRGYLREFLDKFETVELTRKEFKQALDNGDVEWAKRVRDARGDQLRLYILANGINQQRLKIVRQMRAISEQKGLTNEQKADMMEKLSEMEEQLIIRGLSVLKDIK